MNIAKLLTLPARLVPIVVFAVAAAILVADYFSGPDVRFTILYVVPVAYAAWRWRFSPALALAITLPLFRIGFVYLWEGIPALPDAAINAAIQWFTLVSSAVLISHAVAQQKRIRVLEGILPICSFCKKIRGPNDNWETVEHYVSQRSSAQFSHTYCPTCTREHYPDIFK